MDFPFLYKHGYNYASTHVHPMSTDGAFDFAKLTAPSYSFTALDATVVRNSILVQSMLVQEALNGSTMRWRAIVYDFLDQILESLRSGDQQFQTTMSKIIGAWPDFQLCDPAPRNMC